MFAGKRAMCSLTVGGPNPAYSEQGMYGPISSILFPIHHGILSFTGFAVIEPFVVYGPGRMNQHERIACLARYRDYVLGLKLAPTIPGLKSSDYEGFVLKSAVRARLCRASHLPANVRASAHPFP